nr:hypothetical protein [Tanacetum cinerariifolium]
MSTQQDIFAAGSESRPPMLNKENYVPWLSRLLHYAKSRPNGKLIHNSILNGPYVRRMIPEPGDVNREVTRIETFHVQIDDELTDKALKQIEADDQAIQTILLGLPKDSYAAVDRYETTQEIWLRVQQIMKGSDIGIQEKNANENGVDMTQDHLALMANSNNPYAFPAPHQDQSSFNQNYLQQPILNPEDITDPTTAMNMALALNPCNRKIAQPGMNMGQDRQMQMVGGNGGNQFRQYAGQNARNITGNQNRLIGVQGNGNQNQIGNGNLVAARAEGNAAGQNGNQIRCYNCRGVNHYARNCTVRPRRRDAAYLQTQLLIAQKEEQASTSGTQTNKAFVYDSNGSAEVHENCDDNEIFNMFTQEEHYTELLEPIPESHQVSQNDNDVISEDISVEQGGEIVEQHPVNFEETRALYESLY